MNSQQWKKLNKQVADGFASFKSARAKGETINKIDRIGQFVTNALKLASVVSNPVTRKKFPPVYSYTNDVDGRVMPNGPAEVLLNSLPEPKTLFADACAHFYFVLVRGAIDSRAPADLFLRVLNYSNSLLEHFQDTHFFNDLDSFERLELDLRKRLLTNDCEKAIIGKNQAEYELVIAYRNSIRRVADAYLRHHDYGGSVGSLVREINTKYPKIPAVTDNVKYEILFWARYYNQLLGVLPPLELIDGFERMTGNVTEAQLQRIEDLKAPDIEDIELKNMSIRQWKVTFGRMLIRLLP
jgi:hypothetical protein